MKTLMDYANELKPLGYELAFACPTYAVLIKGATRREVLLDGPLSGKSWWRRNEMEIARILESED